VFAASLRRNVHHRPLQELEQSLLHPFPRHITRNGGIVALAGDLVDLINKDNAPFGGLHVIVGHLQQAGQQTLYVFAHIAGFGKHRGVNNRKGYMQHPGNGTRQKGLARPGLPYQNDVGLFNLGFIVPDLLPQPLVMVVDSHGQNLLGTVLPDDILVKKLLDLPGFHQLDAAQIKTSLLFHLLQEDGMRLLRTPVTNMTINARNEQVDIPFLPSAERTLIHFPF